ncbi:tetratricopeptide repeat protein [uncultured Aquimarina sp.]|uniref:tetratricopeptide repeat protein n=1 Tax=uncultured Aquimarina sp. TaxID=575652 RepID=UPI002604B455|nr:tetratricopeptide repeat protein [uncultured Aquimarina sp.]
MKKYTTSFLLLFSFLLFSQEKGTTLTRLEKEVDNAIVDTSKIRAMLELGEYQLKRDFDKAEEYFIEALDLIKENSESYYERFRAAIYVQMGVVNRRKANYPEAISYYIKALKFYEKEKNASKIASVFHNMALVYRYQKDHRKAIENYKKAIVLKVKVKDTQGLGAVYNMLGVSYRQNKQLDSALICYQKAEKLFTAIDSKEDLHGVYGNLGALYGFQGKYDQSIPLKKVNLKYYKKIGKRLSICVEYYNIYQDYRRMKNWKNALVYADSSLQVALEEGFRERIMVAYRSKSISYANMGNYREAHENYRIYKKYNDTIFNIKNAKKIQSLELNYKFQKEKQADSLQFVREKREVELIAKTESSKKKLYFTLLIITLIAGGSIAFLIRRNYKHLARIAQAEHENDRIRLDQEIINKEESIKRLIADNSMRLAFKEELLDKIKNGVVDTEPENIAKSLQSLTAQLKRQITTERKLSGLQEKIDQANKDFDHKLQEHYPKLTKGEREVCALLRLDLSIKEIMTIRDVSVDSVKSMRRRIRKKMNVPEGKELEQFIRELT